MSTERSASRGREAVTYTYGRGGAGNKVRSPSRDPAGQAGPDDYSATRGRELAPTATEGKIITYGRGGAANHRSLSRDAVAESRNALEEEAKYVREHATSDVPVSHGRGGAGNISNSRSRSRSRDPTALPGNPAAVGILHGKGGFGNVSHTDGTDSTLGRLAEEDENRRIGAERHEREDKDGQVHSTGRGGFANFFHRTSTDGNSTRDKSRDASKTRKSGEFLSTGRGGVANIVHRD